MRTRHLAWGGVVVLGASVAIGVAASGGEVEASARATRQASEMRELQRQDTAREVSNAVDRKREAGPPGPVASKAANGSSQTGDRPEDRLSPWTTAWQAADGLRRHKLSGGEPDSDAAGSRAVWGDSKTDGEWLRVRIPGDSDDTVELDGELEDEAVSYPMVLTRDGVPHPLYDPVAFAEKFDVNNPLTAVLDDGFHEGLAEFDAEWPLESIVVTIELMVEKNALVADALREIMAEHVPSFDAADHDTVRALAFEIGEYVLAGAPELPEVMAIAQSLVDHTELGGLMAMYVATATYSILESDR